MDVKAIAVDKDQARDLYQKYKTHQHYETELDQEVRRCYQLISQGKVIIQALDAIKASGLDEKGLPKLALAGATARACIIRRHRDGRLHMSSEHAPVRKYTLAKEKTIYNYHAESFSFDKETFPTWEDGGKRYRRNATDHRSSTPIIPIHLRPKRGLQNYHILWEAEWTPVPTRDPYLLRRIGKADLWLVCAAWDLTDVERAAMATRIVVQ